MSTPPPAPGHDVFPVHSRADVDENGKVTAIVTQLDLTELQSALAPRLADPDSEFTSSEVIPRPDPANQTKGPHRYTIYVPHDDGSKINVGAAHWPFSPGIGMATKTNISFETYGESPTFMSLGVPPLDLGLGDSNASGYSLYTSKYSNHIAKQQLTISSQDESVGINAATDVVVHAKAGNVSVEAGDGATVKGQKVTISASTGAVINADWADIAGAVFMIGADTASFAAPLAGLKGPQAGANAKTGASTANFVAGFISGNAKKLKEQWIAAASGHVNYFLTHVATIAGLALSFKKTWKEPKKGASAWEIKSAKATYAMSVVAELMAIYKEFPKAADPTAPGCISIDAESAIAMSAKGAITVNGANGVALTGFKGVSMGGLTASMKGHKEATVFGGLGASLKSLAGDVAMSSDLKGATVKGKKDVEMSSEAGKATFTGNLDTQLNSITAKTFVHGKTAVFAGTTEYGMVAKNDGVEIGIITGGADFGGAAVADKGLSVSGDGVVLAFTAGSSLTMSSSEADLTSGKLTFKSDSTVTIKGSNINIG
jgi:hypothetical protein